MRSVCWRKLHGPLHGRWMVSVHDTHDGGKLMVGGQVAVDEGYQVVNTASPQMLMRQ